MSWNLYNWWYGTATTATPQVAPAFDPHKASDEQLEVRIETMARPTRFRPTHANTDKGEKSDNNLAPGSVAPLTAQQLRDRDLRRGTLLAEIEERVARYSARAWRWSALYHWFGVSALACNVAVLVLSTRGSDTDAMDKVTLAWILVSLSAYAALVIPLNSQLQSRMQAQYFSTAAKKYRKLRALIWEDLELVEAALVRYEEKFGDEGLGYAVDVGTLAGALKSVRGRGRSGDADQVTRHTPAQLRLRALKARRDERLAKNSK